MREVLHRNEDSLLYSLESVSDPISPLLRGFVFFGVFVVAQLFEAWRPLRKPTQNKRRRVFINVGIAATAALALRFTFFPVVMGVAVFAESRQIGLTHYLQLSGLIGIALSVVALDWTLYYWHGMLHKIPFLWRFHNVHHVDLDLDTSTALRFHFGELAMSAFYRSAQVLIFGISPFSLVLFEMLITTFAQFHHSNVRLPIGFERFLSKAIITPRLHGIHHSIVRQETDSNFGTILTIWDYLHTTFRGNVPQDRITIGVPSFQDPRELGLFGALGLPFRRQRVWRTIDGSEPQRIEEARESESHLLA